MDQLSGDYYIERMCHALKVSRSGYYKYLAEAPGGSKRARENELLLKVIYNVWINHRRVYGSPRINQCLRAMGYYYNIKRIVRIMRDNAIKAKRTKKYHRTTNSRHSYKAAPNLLLQNFDVSELNKVWLSDITYIRTKEGFLYLAVIMDLCSRMPVAYAMENHMRTTLVLEPLRHAIQKRGHPKELIFHSDQGIQYASEEFKQQLSKYSVTQSMSSKGNCYDNAPMESFFHTLKTELVYLEKFNTRKEAENAIKSYIDDFYIRIRLHSYLNYKSPKDFEDSLFVA